MSKKSVYEGLKEKATAGELEYAALIVHTHNHYGDALSLLRRVAKIDNVTDLVEARNTIKEWLKNVEGISNE